MSYTLTFRILGCGSSGGVPRLGGSWGACNPAEPKNRWQRCSLLVTRQSGDRLTRVLIDTSPDMRNQLLDADVGALDAVIYTHAHADHVHGLDDLRMLVINTRQRLPVWADRATYDALTDRFNYIFKQPEGSSYPPICDLNLMEGDVTINGAAGPITFTPFEVQHGSIKSLGFRMHDVVYLPDVSDIPQAVWHHVEGLQVWIVDALRREPHPSHSHLAQTLDWIARAAPQQAVITNMHNDLDYATLQAETPAHITPAFDGMEITLPITTGA